MSKRQSSRVLEIAVALFCFAQIADAQLPIRLGIEFQVNTYTPGDQGPVKVASNGTGDFVVIWESAGQDGANKGVFGKRFTSAGAVLGTEFRVNSYTTSYQSSPDVARDDAGDFVVVWASDGNDGSLLGIFARRFDASGTPVASEFRVNSYTSGTQTEPAVDLDADGDFVVTWTSYDQDGSGQGIFARRFNSSGSALAAEFLVNELTVNVQYGPDVTLDANGDFVIAWTSFLRDGSNYGISSRRFSSSGSAAFEVQVNAFTIDVQKDPVVAADDAGNFLVVWRRDDVGAHGLFGRRLNSVGSPQGAEFQVHESTSFIRTQPAIDMEGGGRFVVSWQSDNQDGDYYGIFARRFDAAGVPRGGELQVNSYTPGYQFSPSVALDGDGDFVISWFSLGQDGSGAGVFAQRFARDPVLDIDGNGTVSPLTDGLLALRFMFGFSGTTLTSGAVGNGCTRCNAAAIEPYLQGLV